jgi:hypothetical protein
VVVPLEAKDVAVGQKRGRDRPPALSCKARFQREYSRKKKKSFFDVEKEQG